jgi:hypothetical protein
VFACCIWCFHGIFALIYWDAHIGICTSIDIGYTAMALVQVVFTLIPYTVFNICDSYIVITDPEE